MEIIIIPMTFWTIQLLLFLGVGFFCCSKILDNPFNDLLQIDNLDEKKWLLFSSENK